MLCSSGLSCYIVSYNSYQTLSSLWVCPWSSLEPSFKSLSSLIVKHCPLGLSCFSLSYQCVSSWSSPDLSLKYLSCSKQHIVCPSHLSCCTLSYQCLWTWFFLCQIHPPSLSSSLLAKKDSPANPYVSCPKSKYVLLICLAVVLFPTRLSLILHSPDLALSLCPTIHCPCLHSKLVCPVSSFPQKIRTTGVCLPRLHITILCPLVLSYCLLSYFPYCPHINIRFPIGLSCCTVSVLNFHLLRLIQRVSILLVCLAVHCPLGLSNRSSPCCTLFTNLSFYSVLLYSVLLVSVPNPSY